MQDALFGRVKRAAYALLDARHLFRGVPRVVNGDEIRLPARWSRYYPASYEVERADFLRQHAVAGATVLDLGAHIGVVTTLLSRAVGPSGSVIAVEASAGTADVLRKTIQLNNLENTSVIQAAVGAQSGVATFYETGDPASNASSLVQTGRTRLEALTPVVTVDDLAAGREVSVIKMDVEGAELDALLGGEKTIRRDMPAMTVEIHPVELGAQKSSAREVLALLRSWGYDLREGDSEVTAGRLNGMSCFEVQARPNRLLIEARL